MIYATLTRLLAPFAATFTFLAQGRLASRPRYVTLQRSELERWNTGRFYERH